MKKAIGKRLLSIMFTLALVFTMMPIVPGAVQKVEAAETETINITDLDMNLIVGQKPDTTVGYGSDIQSVVVTWKDDNTGEVISGNFEVGMRPRLKIDVVVKNSNSFADSVALYINGVGAYGYSAKDDNKFSYSIPFGTLRAQVPETIEITGLDLDISANEVLDTAVSVNTDAVTCEVQWTDNVNGDKLTKAEYYTSIKMRFVVRPVEGYDFVASPKLKVNGTLVEASKISDSQGALLVYIKEFSQIVPSADKIITEVGITGSDFGRENLVIGNTPVLDYTCLDDRVNFACWYEDDITGNKITKFAAGQEVRLKFEMTPKDGYVFPYDTKATVYVNGDNIFVHGNSTFKKVTASVPYGVLTYSDIGSLNITDYAKPSPNHAPDTEFGLSDTNVASANFAWTDSNGNSVTKFEAGKTYTCTATFVGKSGHGFSSVAYIRLMYKGIPYLTFGKSSYVLTDYNNKLVATATYTIPVDAAEEHIWDAGTITTKPTCVAEGVKTYTCVCGATKTEPVAKSGHSDSSTYIVDNKKATCAEEGYTGDTYCKDCGEKIATGTKIAKTTNHAWDVGVVTKQPTATEKGEKTYTCKVCKATKKEVIEALGVPKKGSKYTSDDGKAKYKITKSDAKKGTVTFVAPANKKATTVTIPSTVKIKGITFKVTAIEKNAFKNNKKIKSVTIGKNVTTIGSKAFYGCSKLKTLKIKTTKLTTKKIGSKAFSKTPKSMKVTVPKKKFKTYKSMLIKKGVNKKAKFVKG